MSSLQVFAQDGIEILINRETGESFCSVSGYARMSGKAQSTIAEREKTYRRHDGKTSEVLTSTGLKTVRLIDEDQISDWLPKDNPAMASKLMKLGVRLFLHQIAGYNHQKVSTPQTYLEALKALVAAEEEKEMMRLEKQLLEEENNRLAEIADELFDYSSIIRIAKFNNCSESLFHWRSAD